MKIKFWKIVSDSYCFVFSDLGRFYRISGAWILLTTALAILTSVSIPPIHYVHPAIVLVMSALTLVYGIANTAGIVAFAVAWHRVVLKDEVPRTLRTLRYGRREFRFIFNYFLIGCAMILIAAAETLVLYFLSRTLDAESLFLDNSSLPQFLFSRAAFPSDPVFPNYMLVFLAAAWTAPIFCSRLFLALPAVAIDESGAVLDQAWKRGRANNLRIFFGLFVTALPFWLGRNLFSLAINAAVGRNMLGRSIDVVVAEVAMFVGIALGTTFLSLAYKQLPIQEEPSGYADAVSPP